MKRHEEREEPNELVDIRLELTIQEVNTILGALGDRTFREVYELVDKIQRQARSQLVSAGEPVGGSGDPSSLEEGVNGI